jgi:hypothetical protein
VSIVYAQTRNELLESIARYNIQLPTQPTQNIMSTIDDEQVAQMKERLQLAVDYVQASRSLLTNNKDAVFELEHVANALDNANVGILKLAQIVDRLLDIIWQAPVNTPAPATWQQHEAAKATPPHAPAATPQAATPPWPVHFASPPQLNPTATPQPPVLTPTTTPPTFMPQVQWQVLEVVLKLTLEKQLHYVQMEQLKDMVAARAYTLNNVANVEVLNKYTK